jgi:hypothetical protein
MAIKEWLKVHEQCCYRGEYEYSVPRLIELAKDLPTIDLPLKYLCTYKTYNELTLRDMVMHMNAVNNADLSFPIILDEDGMILDGHHRVMKALLLGEESIKVKRFEFNPPSD